MKPIKLDIDPDRLAALRATYNPAAMTAAEVQSLAAIVPRFGPWNEGIAKTFYEPTGPMQGKDRERCLIALLASDGAALSLVIHVYRGLMEGLSPKEVVQIVGLVACYTGLPKLTFGIEVLHRAFRVLEGLAATESRLPGAVISALVQEFL